MIGKIKKGHRMIGLIHYLAGPGRSNEHTNMHVVCSSELIATVTNGETLNAQNTMALGHEMNHPKKTFQMDNKRAHVFHVSLSLDPTMGVREDDFWETMVREYLQGMEMDGSDGKPPMRWTAIRHGVSSNGNDHVHIAVSMIREDGTWWSADKDLVRNSKVLRAMEQKHGLRVLGQGVKTQGYAEGELQSVARRRAMGKYTQEAKKNPAMVPWDQLDKGARESMVAAQTAIEQPRHELALKVRAAGAGAKSEAEYVRRLRGNGLLVRPYFSKGSTTEVSGYSVALRPVHGERPIWYGGGTLAKDLTLPALRTAWPEGNRVEAVGEWQAAGKNRPTVTHDPAAISGAELGEYFKQISGYLKTLSEANVQDPAQYAAIAREGAGLFASWAVAAGAEGDANAKHLAEASKLFARHAQLSEEPRRAVTTPSTVFADLCTHAAISMSARAGNVAVIRAWATMGEKLGEAFKARGWAQRSEALRDDLRAQLDSVHDAYRIINPLPVKDTAGTGTKAGGVAVAERTTQTQTATEAKAQRQAQLSALEQRLRAAGVPEQAIAARMFAEQQDKFGAGQQPAGTQANVQTATRPDPRPDKAQGPEKGITR